MDDLGVLLALIDTIISKKILYVDTQSQTLRHFCKTVGKSWPHGL